MFGTFLSKGLEEGPKVLNKKILKGACDFSKMNRTATDLKRAEAVAVTPERLDMHHYVKSQIQ